MEGTPNNQNSSRQSLSVQRQPWFLGVEEVGGDGFTQTLVLTEPYLRARCYARLVGYGCAFLGGGASEEERCINT